MIVVSQAYMSIVIGDVVKHQRRNDPLERRQLPQGLHSEPDEETLLELQTGTL